MRWSTTVDALKMFEDVYTKYDTGVYRTQQTTDGESTSNKFDPPVDAILIIDAQVFCLADATTQNGDTFQVCLGSGHTAAFDLQGMTGPGNVLAFDNLVELNVTNDGGTSAKFIALRRERKGTPINDTISVFTADDEGGGGGR